MSKAWSSKPTFLSPDGPISTWPKPELAEEDEATWEDIISAYRTPTIATSVKGVALQSVNAGGRYSQLSRLVDKYPRWPLALTLLAEVHYLLNDTYGASVMIKDVQQIIGVGCNPVLDAAANELATLLEEEDDGEPETSHPDLKLKPYRRPEESSKEPGTEQIAIAEFARLAVLSTNIFEGVFSVEGQSWPLLIKRGFYTNAIEGISRTSGIQKKKKIVQI
ncbi:hypothetical protein HDV00_001785 [Rhizophlyctis rosea]|nr:hypothetical protein HDV00_001785 [Rhizophlyctis rosea]